MAEPTAYEWEKGVERSWESIQEDESGALQLLLPSRKRHVPQRSRSTTGAVQKRMIRYLYVIVDLSQAMSDTDLKPNRLGAVVSLLETFVSEFFDQNPISNLGIIVTKNGTAERLTELSGNPKRQIEGLKKNMTTSGYPSLQNALELARASLQTIPSYGTCEVVVIFGSLGTADPGDIHSTISSLKKEETSGTYYVALDREHMQDLLRSFLQPPPAAATSTAHFASLVQMGFPMERVDRRLSLCVCHQQFRPNGFLCPRCKSKVCELPTTCPICTLPLVSSPHIARSYHHLFPVPAYKEISDESELQPRASTAVKRRCFSCLTPFFGSPSASSSQRLPLLVVDPSGTRSTVFCHQCPSCHQCFCSDCDIYVHESLHNCPGCQDGQWLKHLESK